ncbi:hypothetical protein B0H66DRAFT_644513 [Apodospora peruviana]|uniref:Saccharopine dehydrogenase NADP binding domain-containing protein n=1 Tax=Apodospora peruviana TaxID=516989 RepID=A0AAE0HSU1_9PEZI|nr:hypothetical protein B0H66DRAFT_644513 [Apodospora peruviana]
MGDFGPELLLIGATGHVGGAVLDKLLIIFPDLQIVALVRLEKDADDLKNQYARHMANLRTVVGDLDDVPFLESLATHATIIINCAPDVTFGPGISALLKGLASSIAEQGSGPNSPRFYVGTSGAAIIWDAATGSAEARAWDDVSDIDDILAIPDSLTHAATDRIVRSANTLSPLLHTAIVSPSFITGISPSAKRPTPLIFPDWLHVVKTLGSGLVVNGGLNRSTFVDVRQLARLYVCLVGDGLERLSSASKANGQHEKNATGTTSDVVETWGPRAYYFAASLEVSMREFMTDILLPALKKHGAPYIKSTTDLKNLRGTNTAADIIMERHGAGLGAELWSGHIAEGFGVNMRVRGTRAEKVFEGFRWQEGKEFGGDAGIDEAVGLFLDLEKKGESS